MRCEPHPISGIVYRELEGGLVELRDDERARRGVFRWDGTWVDGDLTEADIHFLRYIGGPNLPEGTDIYWPMLPVAGQGSLGAQQMGGAGSIDVEAGSEMPKLVGKYISDPGVMTEQGMRSAGHMDLGFFLDNDRKPELVPEVYRLESPMPGGPMRVDTDRFVDQRYHELEVERLWKKVWQMACREDDIPNVGDYYIYDIAHLSYIVVRTGEKEFKAHLNVCLHRGRILRERSGKNATEFRCRFHGWSWKIDGSLKGITCEWDFPNVREDAKQLTAAKVGTWGGFVFINPDVNAQPLEEFLGPVMIAHYEKFNFGGKYKHAHVSRKMFGNWKVVMEAFLEAYHTIATHPQIMLMAGDGANLRYDVFGNWARASHVSPLYISPQRGMLPSKEDVLKGYRAAADLNKRFLRTIIGDEVEKFSDAELNDGNFCDVFPNLHPWSGWGRIVFRFRPYGDKVNECLMDVILLGPWPVGKPKPPAVQERRLAAEQSWCDAPEIGNLARIIDQDCDNVAQVQGGLKAKNPGHVWYSAYQEGKIRHFHELYDKWVGRPE